MKNFEFNKDGIMGHGKQNDYESHPQKTRRVINEVQKALRGHPDRKEYTKLCYIHLNKKSVLDNIKKNIYIKKKMHYIKKAVLHKKKKLCYIKKKKR